MTKVEGGGVVAWSPDAARLAVTLSSRQSADATNDASAILIDAERPMADQVVDRLPPNSDPNRRFVPDSWSLDGRWITGQSWYGVPGVVIYSVEARTFERLTTVGEWPVWLADSRRVLYVSRGREFHVLATRTRTTKQIFSVLRDTLGPPRMTRDGRQIFFSRRVTESDVWMVNLH
jgi:Tol biopolymer transport system component